MRLFAIMSADGMTPAQIVGGTVQPVGSIDMGEGADPSVFADKLLVGGVWVSATPLADPVESVSVLGYELAFPAVPIGAVVKVFHIEAAAMIANVEVSDGTAEVLLTVPGTYSVEVRSPAPVKFWSKVVAWSA